MKRNITWTTIMFHNKSPFYWVWTGLVYFSVAVFFISCGIRGSDANAWFLVFGAIAQLGSAGVCATMAYRTRHEFEKLRIERWASERK